MADQVWPPTLPQKFLTEGFSNALAPNIISTDFEVGDPQTRPRSTYKGNTFVGKMKMSGVDVADQLFTFQTFYETTTIYGTLPFDFQDPFYGTTGTYKFDQNNLPSITHMGGTYYEVSFGIIEVADV